MYSPLPFPALAAGLAAGLRLGSDARRALPHALRAMFSADTAVLCGSGTQALSLAVRTAARLAREEPAIALPAYTCYDVASAAIAADLPLHLYDVDPDTLTPDLASLERALEAGARVVVVTPLFGIPVDWEAIEAVCARYGAVTVEDAAQGFGATWRSRRLGSFGPISVLSFGRGKGWTGGQGGAMLLRGSASQAAFDRSALGAAGVGAEVSAAVVAIAQTLLGRPALYRIPLALPGLRLGETVYREAPPPAAMSRVAARLAQRSLARAEEEAAARTRNAAALLEALRPHGPLTPFRVHADASPGYLRLSVRASRGVAGFARPSEAAELGVAPGYPTALSDLVAVRERLARPDVWPGADQLARELITLPTHSLLSGAEREQLLRAINSYRQ